MQNKKLEKTKFLSLILPVYNEEASLRDLINSLRLFASKYGIQNIEIIFVDDHSSDDTNKILMEVCDEVEYMKYMRLSANKGSHMAILAGLMHARGDCAAFLASDLQDSPNVVFDLLAELDKGNDIVWAVRKSRESIPRREILFSKAFYYIMNKVSKTHYPPEGSDFALLSRKAIDALTSSASHNFSLGGELAHVGFNQSYIHYNKESRKYGKSSWTFLKKINSFFDALISFSYFPIRLVTFSGLFVVAISMLYAIFVVFMRLYYKVSIAGWASTIIIILVLSGLQLVMLGVFGEYIWRIFEQSKGRPLFTIEDQSSDLETHKVERDVYK